MNRTIVTAVTFALVGVCVACGTDKATPSDAGAPIDSGSAVVTGDAAVELTNVDVSNNTMRRFGAPQVAVNPKNPDNIVVLAQSNMGYTRTCLPAAADSDCQMVTVGSFGPQPLGAERTAAFLDVGVFASSDRGKTFKQIDVSKIVPPGHPEINSKGEGPLAVMADGTFYIAYNAINWGSDWQTNSPVFFPNGGVGVIKSTDGGMSWSWVSLTQTPSDWPYGVSDLSTGTFYAVSGLAGLTPLGPRSTGMAGSPTGTITDRWVTSMKKDGTWTAPQPLGGTNGTTHVNANESSVTAALGVVATVFEATSQSACSFFLGDSSAPSSCIVFETSTDAGATWSRHAVPAPAGFSPPLTTGVLLEADPMTQGHFTVILLDQAGSEFYVYQTRDSGKTFSGPTMVTEDATKKHAAPWMAYSPTGELGLMWRTYEPDPTNPQATSPYAPSSIWAVVSSDGGATFSQPLKVNKVTSPAPPNDPNDAFRFLGDHGPEGMTLDAQGNVYVVWADWTPGERSIFLSAVNVQAFKH
jgi:hypothetical protein